MKTRNLIIVLLALFTVGGIFIYARTRTDDARGVVSVWCVDGGTASGALDELAKEYNHSLSRAQLPVEIKRFTDEAELAAALDSATPDIILCTHYRAFEMHARGKLADISSALNDSALEYPMALSSRSASIGSSFFPLGMQAQVLLVNTALCGEAELTTMDALSGSAQDYCSETGAAFYAVDSYSALFFTELLREGDEFTAQLLDKPTGAYKALYNLLADDVYSGALLPACDDAAAHVLSGELACAIVPSSALPNKIGRGFEIRPVPPLYQENDSGYLGEAWGLAVTAGGSRSADDIASFISWLLSGNRGVKLALECGLIPAQESTLTTHDALWGALIEVYKGKIAALPTADSAYAQGYEAFESEFCERLRFLYQ